MPVEKENCKRELINLGLCVSCHHLQTQKALGKTYFPRNVLLMVWNKAEQLHFILSSRQCSIHFHRPQPPVRPLLHSQGASPKLHRSWLKDQLENRWGYWKGAPWNVSFRVARLLPFLVVKYWGWLFSPQKWSEKIALSVCARWLM